MRVGTLMNSVVYRHSLPEGEHALSESEAASLYELSISERMRMCRADLDREDGEIVEFVRCVRSAGDAPDCQNSGWHEYLRELVYNAGDILGADRPRILAALQISRRLRTYQY